MKDYRIDHVWTEVEIERAARRLCQHYMTKEQLKMFLQHWTDEFDCQEDREALGE